MGHHGPSRASARIARLQFDKGYKGWVGCLKVNIGLQKLPQKLD